MEDDQEKYLDEAMSVIKHQAYYMKAALDKNSLREALKHSSAILGELRTSLLSPRNYYNLYMAVFDELRYLEIYFLEEQRNGRKMADLYESVQHAAFIVPRLYLLITVGSVYIKTHEAPAKEILKDLLEMVKSVQHPTRGLFLRYYLLKSMKDKLPDKGSEYEGEGGDLNDAIEFILQNLSEMNRLWVRLQHINSGKDKSKREAERNDLRVTVGENVIRLSNLDGVTLDIYKATVLPKILEIVQACKDTLSQQYLMDCIIQAFPDEYHLNTLESLLSASTTLQPTVDIKTIFVHLMDRLSQYASNSENDLTLLTKDVDIFALFKKYTDKLIDEQGTNIELKKLLELEVAFLRFSIKSYPNDTEHVNMILESCVKVITTQGDHTLDNDCLKLLVKLLSIPLETLSLAILGMNHYPKLMVYLQFNMRKTVAARIVHAVLKSKKILDNLEIVRQLIVFIEPLLKDNADTVEGEPYEFEEEQEAVAKLVHLLTNEDPDVFNEMLGIFKRTFLEGGKQRMKYTLPSLVFCYFKLSRQLDRVLQSADTKPAVAHVKVFNAVLEQINAINSLYPENALRLYLQAAQAINEVHDKSDLEDVAYEFVSQALLVYQDELSDSETKFSAINLIVSSIQTLNCFDTDNYDTLASNATTYASTLLKRPSQCEAILYCSTLFYNDRVKDGTKVMQCLKKALKIADVCMQNPKNLYLFVLILNKYLYFWHNDSDFIKLDDINHLIELISEHISTIKNKNNNEESIKEVLLYLERTKEAVGFKRTSKPERYKDIVF